MLQNYTFGQQRIIPSGSKKMLQNYTFGQQKIIPSGTKVSYLPVENNLLKNNLIKESYFCTVYTFGYKKIYLLVAKRSCNWFSNSNIKANFSTGGASFREYISLKDDLPSNPKFSFEASGLSVQSLCDLCHWEFWRCTTKLF